MNSTFSVSITATDLLEYSFCPRFTYFERFLELPEHQERRFKVRKGREIHEEKQRVNRHYLRKTLQCEQRDINVHLYGNKGLYSGVVDEVLHLKDGSAAPLDYKWAEWKGKIFLTYQLQLTFYSTLIEETFQKPSQQGFLVYVRSKNKFITHNITKENRNNMQTTIESITRIRTEGWYPNPTNHRRQCLDCCYQNVCEKF